MSKKTAILNNLIMSLIFTVLFCVAGQYFGTGVIDFSTLPLPLAVGFVLGFAIVQFVPCVPLGMRISNALQLSPGGVGSYVCMSCCIAVIMATIMTFVMTWFTMGLLGGAPFAATMLAASAQWSLFVLMAIIVAVVVSKPVQTFAKAVTGGVKPATQAS